MSRKLTTPCALVAATIACLCAPASLGGPPPQSANISRLVLGSEYVHEFCLGPCACPGHTERGPMQGRWVLFPAPPEPFFDVHDAAVREWRATANGQPVTLTGAGRYWYGGDFALTHRLTLMLSINGAAPVLFDSGFVVVQPPFPPRIVIAPVFDGVICQAITLDIRSAPTCPADLTGDGFVTFADLNEVLGAFGAVGQPGFVPGDANANGATDFADLNLVLSDFGQAC